ncbi:MULTISPECIES: hypothetical protein [unclassified Mesorhizobium]|uniref:hypothetical protein n=1 Tax=unclassified Mesorhizobium TaxID=325217 RepID=UPI000FDCC852|nr:MULTISPECIES: hypothetical protein [unclassified Mesorhizobium]TGR39972.1 hypothetical protein EN842_38995 [bacterium M00.F.Ca.ET.199.01.1.1]TGU24176.1 hypothetical protein EN799_48280 [bacterium M00.F.Ca.ET.156.01.1.1]TGV89392.1 hypothetical protein EN792_004255 [Mesorhizobium sp. M00.F.Ca.ET.149.01.1.1]TGR23349.1 hypothetical protein EN845_20315 [Mesorhizobium sp. M8A.F.Ca.ET.202.01.1.1]TGR24582.1 hypothetical protein EN840_18960 [Mesorhizobium sp. M8A.F.Ca.ET.197.01.1.1]
MTIDQTTAKVLTDLLRELSSELDLHHDDGEFRALKPTIETLQRAAALMTDAGLKTPEVYHHVMRRFERATRS